jgi:glycosyltransferase involved in cell wall biosynthesis
MVDAVIVKSAEMARVLAPLTAHVIPNGVDLETFAPMDKQEAHLQLGWPANKRHVLFPGNPAAARKCYPLADAAVKSAQHQLKEAIELVVLWDVSPRHVPLYMNACDAMLMTSFIEGSPNVVKEAMACNLPLVSVPVGDVPELVEGVSGYDVRPRDADEIGAALAGLLLQRPAVHGRQALIRMGLGLDSIARRICGLYESVLQSRATHI